MNGTRTRTIGRRLSALVVAIAVTLVVAVPAMAASEQGSKTCSLGQVALRGETTGVTYCYVPNDSSWDKRANHGLTLQVSYYVSGYSSSTWKVYTSGYLYGPGTYAYCSGI